MFWPSAIFERRLKLLSCQALITCCCCFKYFRGFFQCLQLLIHLLHLSLFVRLPDLAPHRCSRSTIITRAVIRRQAWRTAHLFFFPEFFNFRKIFFLLLTYTPAGSCLFFTSFFKTYLIYKYFWYNCGHFLSTLFKNSIKILIKRDFIIFFLFPILYYEFYFL